MPAALGLFFQAKESSDVPIEKFEQKQKSDPQLAVDDAKEGTSDNGATASKRTHVQILYAFILLVSLPLYAFTLLVSLSLHALFLSLYALALITTLSITSNSNILYHIQLIVCLRILYPISTISYILNCILSHTDGLAFWRGVAPLRGTTLYPA